MQILYISALSSQKLVDDIFARTSRNPGFAAQKFNRLVVKGFIGNGHSVIVLSNPPFSWKRDRKLVVSRTKEVEDSIRYQYIPSIGLPYLKQFCILVYTFCYVLFWKLNKRNEDNLIVCDAMCVTASLGATFGGKLANIKTVSIVTDIYGNMVDVQTTKNRLNLLAKNAFSKGSGYFDYYVLLTEQMNEIVNPQKRPHIVMEALCSVTVGNLEVLDNQNQQVKTVIYAGGLYVKYGLQALVEGFQMIPDSNIRLVLYGDGDYVSEIKRISEIDFRIEYRGVRPNNEVMQAEAQASLLVNPRFTNEPFSPYSFPSKNMEYMLTGTPVLTTKLPGMPSEYCEYVYLFEEESANGYAKKIAEVLNKPREELVAKGMKAKDFVQNNKNNIVQTQRIIALTKGEY